jgi:hypothetical protein
MMFISWLLLAMTPIVAIYLYKRSTLKEYDLAVVLIAVMIIVISILMN